MLSAVQNWGPLMGCYRESSAGPKSFTAADSPASLINIKLKKKKSQGWNITLSANNIFIPLTTLRERNMISLGLKTFLPRLQEVCYSKKCSTTPFGTSAINSTTNHHLPAVSDQNQNSGGHTSIWCFRSQGITVHAAILSWMAKKHLPSKRKGNSTSSLPSAQAILPNPKCRDWGHCTHCCPWPQEIKTSDIVVSMATSLEDSCAADSNWSEACPVLCQGRRQWGTTAAAGSTGHTTAKPFSHAVQGCQRSTLGWHNASHKLNSTPGPKQLVSPFVSCPMLPALLNDPPFIQLHD